MNENSLKWRRYLSTSLNIAIIATALILSAVLAKKHLLNNSISAKNIARGDVISLPETNWQPNTKTLLLFLYSGCQYCTGSAGFYQRLIKETSNRNDIKLLVVFSKDDEHSTGYLNELNISSLPSKKVSYVPLGVWETPTLAMLDSNGIVQNIWKGKLSSKEEALVLSTLGIEGVKKPEDWFINEDSLQELIKQKETVIIDLREREKYEQEHLANAINIPFDELSIRAINEISQSNTIVVYGESGNDRQPELAELTLGNQGFEDVFILRRKVAH
ncbi:MAG TPA: rhodanese-like domain-containing protein [Pyrinomonadaceae bacterium]|jgi:rhodanese-related sulfurtransferase